MKSRKGTKQRKKTKDKTPQKPTKKLFFVSAKKHKKPKTSFLYLLEEDTQTT
jgi:hypothetical protein